MKHCLRITALLFLCLSHHAFGQSADASDVEKEKAKLPDAVRAVAAKNDAASEKVKAATGDKAAKKSDSKKTNPNDPAQWARTSVHKLAVMDIWFGGALQTVIFELLPLKAPHTVENFVENCKSGVYKDIAFHRAIDHYLVQTGDPLTADESKRNQWGTGGQDKTIPGEFGLPHTAGAVAMARLGDAVNPERRSNAYQFYFVVGNMSTLDGAYSVFGQVISGLDVLQDIAKTPVDSNDCPLLRIEVRSIKIADQKGPLMILHQAGMGRKRFTTPGSAKGPFTRFLERVW